MGYYIWYVYSLAGHVYSFFWNSSTPAIPRVESEEIKAWENVVKTS